MTSKSGKSECLEALSFEDMYSRLEKIIQTLETGEVSLDESMALYEQGVRLARECGRKLDDAQLRVTQLLSSVEVEQESESCG